MAKTYSYLKLTSPSDYDLTEAGKNGWELVAVDGTVYVFKKELGK